MLIEFPLYNFDHSYSRPGTFNIGPFTIEVNADHCANLSALKRHQITSLTTEITQGEKLRRAVEYVDSINGETKETAFASVDDAEVNGSILFPKFSAYDKKTDLTLLLSFLTGRKVFLEDETREDHSRHYNDSAVSCNFFRRPQSVWENLHIIQKNGLSPQFYNLVTASSINDFLSFCYYGNATLNAIYENYCKTNGKTKYGKSKKINKIINQAVDTINKSIVTRAQKEFLKLMVKNGYGTDVSSDIEARLRPFSVPSALFKIREFLRGVEIYPLTETDDHIKRLRWINNVRNRVAHEGDIPNDKNLSWEMLSEISVNISFIVFTICQYYFANNMLSLNDYTVNAHKTDVTKYFESGEFRGKRVFDETYDNYQKRLEKEWVESGNTL